MPQTRARKFEIYHFRKVNKLCVDCGREPTDAGTMRCEKHRKEKSDKARGRRPFVPKEQRKAYWDKVTKEVLAAYGNACKCCGEIEPMLLTIDHVFNDGKKHREQGMTSHSYYLWLRRNKYPQDRFQCLCYNCNMGKYKNGGVCPHENSARKLFLVA